MAFVNQSLAPRRVLAVMPDARALRPSLRWLVIGGPLLWSLIINSFNVSPVGREAAYGLDNWVQAFNDPLTINALWNSFSLALVRTGISLPFALGFTWLITRTDMPGRSAIELLTWLGVFSPLLPLALGWILLLDVRFGLINQALTGIPFLHGARFNLYSFWGIAWVYLVSRDIGYKVVLMTPAFRRVGAAIEDAARVCGASLWRATLRITLPLLAPAVLLVTVIGLIFSFESFEVELLLGVPVRFYVYSTRIYELVGNQPSKIGEATALAFIFVIWLFALTALYRRFLRNKSFATVTGSGYAHRPVRLGRWRWVAAGACFGYFAIALAAPFVLLVMGSVMRLYGFFRVPNPFTTTHWQALVNDPAFLSGIRNSLIISSASAVLVVAVYSTIAYAIVRHRARALRVADALVWSPWAMPGIVMSLGFLWLFLATPARAILYGSLLGIIVAFVIRGAPLNTQFFKSSLLQLGTDLEEAGRVAGATWLRAYRKILFRLLAPTAVTTGLITFLNSLYDISLPVLLFTPASRPLSILMLEYSFSGARERRGGRRDDHLLRDDRPVGGPPPRLPAVARSTVESEPMVKPRMKMLCSDYSHMALHYVWRDSGVTQEKRLRAAGRRGQHQPARPALDPMNQRGPLVLD